MRSLHVYNSQEFVYLDHNTISANLLSVITGTRATSQLQQQYKPHFRSNNPISANRSAFGNPITESNFCFFMCTFRQNTITALNSSPHTLVAKVLYSHYQTAVLQVLQMHLRWRRIPLVLLHLLIHCF